jgi:selenoprotein W-related protein
MVEGLLEEFEHQIESIGLIPSKGGVFEVVVDGDLIYSKKETGEHAELAQVADPIRARLAQAAG